MRELSSEQNYGIVINSNLFSGHLQGYKQFMPFDISHDLTKILGTQDLLGADIITRIQEVQLNAQKMVERELAFV